MTQTLKYRVRSAALLALCLLVPSCATRTGDGGWRYAGVPERFNLKLTYGPVKAERTATGTGRVHALAVVPYIPSEVINHASRGNGNERQWASAPEFDSAAARGMEEPFLRMALKQGYETTARSDLGPVLREIAFQRSGPTRQAAVVIGERLKVDALLVISLQNWETIEKRGGSTPREQLFAKVECRLLDCQNGGLLWLASQAVSGTVPRGLTPIAVLDQACENVAAALPQASH